MAELAKKTKTSKQQLKEVIAKDLTCSICNKQYTDPRLLTCLDYFCSRCIQNSCPALEPGKCFVFECPKCGKKTELPNNSAAELPYAYFVKQKENLCFLLRKVEEGEIVSCSLCSKSDKAVAYCRNCAHFVCNFCKELHNRQVRGYEGHKLITIDEIRHSYVDWSVQIPDLASTPGHCSSHSTDADKKPLEYYCIKCGMVICRDCLLLLHHGHSHEGVKNVAPKCRTYLDENLSHLKECCTKVKLSIEKVEEEEAEVGKRICHVRKEVKERFGEIAKAIEKRKDLQLQHAQTIADDKLGHLQEQRESLEISHKRILDLVQFIEGNLNPQHCSDDGLLSLHECVLSRIQEVIKDYEQLNLQLVTSADIVVKAPYVSKIADFLDQHTSVSSPFDVTRSVVEGEGLTSAKCGEESKFMLHLKYSNGQYCLEDKHVVVSLKSLIDESSKVETNITKVQAGMYEVTYLPLIRGRYNLTIQVEGESLPRVPATVFVEYPPQNLITPQLEKRSHACIKGIDNPYDALLGFKGEIIVTEESPASVVYITRTGENSFKSERHLLKDDDKHKIHPSGIALDRVSEIFYVGDCVGNRVLLYDKNWDYIGEMNNIHRPGRITIAKDGLIYVCERGSLNVKIFDKDRNEIQPLKTSAERPVDVKFDSSGNCYVSDVYGGRVLKYSQNGDLLHEFKEKPDGKLLGSPRGLYIHKDYLYVAERDSQLISIFKVDGSFIGEFSISDKLNDPGSIVADKDGFLYVCDSVLDCVFVF